MPNRSLFLAVFILTILLAGAFGVLSLYHQNQKGEAARQHRQQVTLLIGNLQETDRQLVALYQTTARTSITAITFLNASGFTQRTALDEPIDQQEEIEKKATSAVGRSFANLGLFKEISFPAVESYLDEAQKTLVIYQWITTSEKSLKPLLDFLTTLYLVLGRGFFPPLVREDAATHRQTLKSLSSQPLPANLPFASDPLVGARQKIIGDLIGTFDKMETFLRENNADNRTQLKLILTDLQTSLTEDSATAKAKEKDFWPANLQLQKSAYLLEQLQQSLTSPITSN